MYLQVVFYFHNPQDSSHIPPENQNNDLREKIGGKPCSMKTNGKKSINRRRIEGGYKRESIFYWKQIDLVGKKMYFNSQVSRYVSGHVVCAIYA